MEMTLVLGQWTNAGSGPSVNLHESRPPPAQESLKFPADEHDLLEDPLSSTGTLSSMKNLEDAYAIGGQFINDKSIDDEPGKLNVEAKWFPCCSGEKCSKRMSKCLQALPFEIASEKCPIERHLWHELRGTDSLLKRTSYTSDVMTIKILLLLHLIRISVRGDDMTLALLVHHSLQLLSHQHGKSLTLEMLLQDP
ncbi:hypothetical protein Tco_1465955 [Tanacetum coccineum]